MLSLEEIRNDVRRPSGVIFVVDVRAGPFRTGSEVLDFSDNRLLFRTQDLNMPPMLGKRKRPAVQPAEKSAKTRQPSRSDSPLDEEDAHAIFRRHFEAQFKPLPEAKRAVKIAAEPLDVPEEEEVSDFVGLSASEGMCRHFTYDCVVLIFRR